MGEIRWSGVLQNATRNRYPRRVAFWRTPLRNGNHSSAGSRPAPNTLAACFGKKTKARINQIEEILKTLRSLGKLE